jgi:diaminopimelate epimerase
MELKLNNDDTVTVFFSQPSFNKDLICGAHIVDVGNPHAVLVVDAVKTAPVDSLGASISNNDAFPHKTNVEFMQIIDKNKIKLRVYERGVGETLACGSGALAAAVVAIKYYALEPKVFVEMREGFVVVEWLGANNLSLTGEAIFVYEGSLIYEV